MSAASGSARILHVAITGQYVIALERVSRQFPALRPTAAGFVLPLRESTPEEVLAACLAEGVRVTGSKVIFDVFRS
jgi:hypothetical protein